MVDNDSETWAYNHCGRGLHETDGERAARLEREAEEKLREVRRLRGQAEPKEGAR